MQFFYVDVFASRPLEGNPVTVVPDADGLDVATMRAIAREFNQSETTFIVRPSNSAADWRLRSFTPIGAEVFGAGHNALGAWLWLASAGRLAADRERFVQQIGDDLLEVAVERHDVRPPTITMRQSAPEFFASVDDRTELALALGLQPADLRSGGVAQVVSTGAPHLLVELRDRGAVERCTPDSARLLAVLRAVGGEGCYPYALDAIERDAVAHARFFNPTVGITEDPATGTAAGPLVARLVADGVVADGSTAIVEQGHTLGRPSRIAVTVVGHDVRLSGTGLVVADGTLRL